MKTIKTNIGLRNKIVKLYNQQQGQKNGRIKKVADQLGLTYWQVYNAVAARVKLDRSPRADKGKSRKPEIEITQLSNSKPQDFETLEDFLEHQLTISARDLTRRKYTPDVRIKLLKEITYMKDRLQKAKIESWLRRPEAILLVKIMRRLKPELTDEQIKKIYAEEYEKIQRELS